MDQTRKNAQRREKKANEKKKAEAIAAMGKSTTPGYRRKKRVTRSAVREAKKEAKKEARKAAKKSHG